MEGKGNGEWRKIHNEKIKDLYCSPKIIWLIKSRRIRWAGNVASMEEIRAVYRVLFGKSEVKRSLVGHRRRWTDNIKIDLLKVGMKGMDLTDLSQDRVR